METKKFISTLKGFRTRFTKNPNSELEAKSVKGLVEKFGNSDTAVAALDEAKEVDLKEYLKGILGIPSASETPEAKSASKSLARVVAKDDDGKEYVEKDGKIYELDSVKKTMKRVLRDFKELGTADLDLATDKVMPMTVYQRYLHDRFPGEDAPIKKNRLHFKGFRISCNAEDGFVVEDTLNHYAIVETPFEGIPTPKELGDWLEKPNKSDKKVERKTIIVKSGPSEPAKDEKAEEAEPDFEYLRRKVLRLIADARSKTVDVDPEKFAGMIPFKRWKRRVKSLYTQWKNREIRYAKFLNEIETLTKEETFVVEEKKHRSSFTGAILPEFTKVGMLVGDKIEVDGKWIDAVPFLLDYLLFHEKRAMSQIMKYAAGEITDVELIKNPLEVDWKVEYNKRALENTAYNAQVLCMVYDQVGLAAPQDLLYEADLEVGDRILISLDGELKVRKISSVDGGILLGRNMGLLKLDKWIKLPKKETK